MLRLPFHVLDDQIELLQVFVLYEISAIFHHLQYVLLHGF